MAVSYRAYGQPADAQANGRPISVLHRPAEIGRTGPVGTVKMLSREWQDLQTQFRDACAAYDVGCLCLTMTRWVEAEGPIMYLPLPEMDLPVLVGAVRVADASGQKVLLMFQVCGRTHRPIVNVLTDDGHGGRLRYLKEKECEPGEPSYDGEKAVAEFRRLARAGGSLLLVKQELEAMGVLEEAQPEALWAFLLFRQLQGAPGDFISECNDGHAAATVLSNPFTASVLAIDMRQERKPPATGATGKSGRSPGAGTSSGKKPKRKLVRPLIRESADKERMLKAVSRGGKSARAYEIVFDYWDCLAAEVVTTIETDTSRDLDVSRVSQMKKRMVDWWEKQRPKAQPKDEEKAVKKIVAQLSRQYSPVLSSKAFRDLEEDVLGEVLTAYQETGDEKAALAAGKSFLDNERTRLRHTDRDRDADGQFADGGDE